MVVAVFSATVAGHWFDLIEAIATVSPGNDLIRCGKQKTNGAAFNCTACDCAGDSMFDWKRSAQVAAKRPQRSFDWQKNGHWAMLWVLTVGKRDAAH